MTRLLNRADAGASYVVTGGVAALLRGALLPAALPGVHAATVGGAVKEPGRAAFRPSGLAEGPDGALYTQGVAAPQQHLGAMPPMGGSPLSLSDLQAVSAYVWAMAHQRK